MAENGYDGEILQGFVSTPSQRCGSMRLTGSVVCCPFFSLFSFVFFDFVFFTFHFELVFVVHCLVLIVDAGHAVFWWHYCVFDGE